MLQLSTEHGQSCRHNVAQLPCRPCPATAVAANLHGQQLVHFHAVYVCMKDDEASTSL